MVHMRDMTQVVHSDPDRLRAVLLNLYTNAAKFTKSGSIALRVRAVCSSFEPEPPPGWSAVTVTPSYLPQPARAGYSTGTHTTGGTGSAGMGTSMTGTGTAGSAPHTDAG